MTERKNSDFIDIVFDGPPSHESGRFVEAENPQGHSINAGEWIDRGDGTWALRIEHGRATLDELERLQTRQDELLVTIRRLSAEVPYPEESANAAVLIAQVGTLKARVRELEQNQATDRAELQRTRPIYELACKLQDADQCEDHSTGDECDQGTVEHELFETLARVRVDEEPSDRTDALEPGQKKRGPAFAETRPHVLNDVDECVSWCPTCRINRERGLNPDGTAKTKEARRG